MPALYFFVLSLHPQAILSYFNINMTIRLNKEKINDIRKLLSLFYTRILNSPIVHIGFLLAGIISCLVYSYNYEVLKVEIPDYIYINQKNLYIIDSGHGFNAKNNCKWKSIKEGDSCFYEYEFNKKVADQLCKLLDNAGIFYLRTDTLSDERDLAISDRIAIVNATKAALDEAGYISAGKSVVLFSIHANAARNEQASGFEVFTNIDKCKKYKDQVLCEKDMHIVATRLSDHLKLMFPEKKFRGTSKSEYKKTSMANDGEISLIDKTNCYALLSENGFYTNPVEREEMKQPEYQLKIAMAHYKTICSLENINP